MYLDNSLLVNKQKLEGIEKDITCPICQGILNDPYFCIKCQNNFCNKCIKKWEKNNKKCPFRCNNPQYTSNRFLNKIFAELLKFKCQNGCDEVISYKDINEHYENCKKEDFESKYYECATQVEVLKLQIENFEDIKNELEQTQERKGELENELAEIKEEKRDLEFEVDELRDRINELEKELESEPEDIYDLKNKYKNMLKNNEDLTNKLAEEKEQNNLLESKIKSLEVEKKDFEKNMKNLKHENNVLNKEINSLELKIRKLKKSKK